MNHGFVWRLASHLGDFVAGLLLLAKPKHYEPHQHARFYDVWIDYQRFVESCFGLFEIFDTAESLEDAIDMTSSQAVIRKAKVRIQFNRATKVSNRRVAIFGGHRAEDKSRKAIAPAQKLVVGFRVDGFRLCEPCLFVGTKFNS